MHSGAATCTDPRRPDLEGPTLDETTWTLDETTSTLDETTLRRNGLSTKRLGPSEDDPDPPKTAKTMKNHRKTIGKPMVLQFAVPT